MDIRLYNFNKELQLSEIKRHCCSISLGKCKFSKETDYCISEYDVITLSTGNVVSYTSWKMASAMTRE